MTDDTATRADREADATGRADSPETTADGTLTDDGFRTVLRERVENDDVELHPRQWEAVMATPQPITMIHGPPGTGKSTVGGLSVGQELAVSPRPRRVLLTGPTTRAIRELYGAVIEAWAQLAPGVPATPTRPTRLRTRLLTQPDCQPFDLPLRSGEIDHEEVNYRDGAAAQTLHDALTSGSIDRPTVIAGTPGKVDKFVAQMPSDASTPRWDTVVCDEASMIDAGTLALTTGPLAPFDYGGTAADGDQPAATGRLYLIGDHRQLPVIRKAEWDTIRRPGTERHQPQAPALNLIRYLHGQKVEFDTPISGNQRGLARDDITYIPLERSYRMHTIIADHLEPVYLRDDLDFHSEETDTLDWSWSPAPTAGLDTVFHPGPLTVVIHDDTRGGESNPTEADLAAAISEEVTTVHHKKSIGVVTPHNAQKSLIRARCGESVDTVDTVEGFQGAGEDALIASLTVASESVQDREDAWLLDHRRLNVALSRAREKLVVIVPRTLLEFRPDELSTFRDAQVLGELVDSVTTAADDHMTTETTVQDMAGPVLDSLRSHGAASVEVYTHPDTT